MSVCKLCDGKEAISVWYGWCDINRDFYLLRRASVVRCPCTDVA